MRGTEGERGGDNKREGGREGKEGIIKEREGG